MRLQVYLEICKELTKNNQEAIQNLRKKYSAIPFDTFVSIYAQETTKRIRLNHHVYRSPSRLKVYSTRYLAGEDILDLGEEYEIPPCLLARFLLEHLLGLPKSKLGAVLKDPEKIHQYSVPLQSTGSETTHADLLKRFEIDLSRCVENDPVSSPAVEVIRRVTGLEFEVLLCKKLKELNIPFQSEEALRAAGFSKTPDVKLEVPIAIKGRPVMWIDSKACFGDQYNHQTQVTEQFQRYVNRFGPGLVIYWFGYIDELDNHTDVMLMDTFPSNDDIYCLPVTGKGEKN